MKRHGAAGAIRLLSVAVCAAAIGVAGCASRSAPETSAAFLDDASISEVVRTRFVEDKTVDPNAIQVATRDGTVTLSGAARSSLERTNAESLAMKVKGVKLVRNEVSVKP